MISRYDVNDTSVKSSSGHRDGDPIGGRSSEHRTVLPRSWHVFHLLGESQNQHQSAAQHCLQLNVPKCHSARFISKGAYESAMRTYKGLPQMCITMKTSLATFQHTNREVSGATPQLFQMQKVTLNPNEPCNCYGASNFTSKFCMVSSNPMPWSLSLPVEQD